LKFLIRKYKLENI